MNLKVEQTLNPKSLPDFQKLGFGQYFTDHIFMAHFERSKGWHSFELAPYKSLNLDPAASVLHYGQALFEGMKAFKRPSGQIVLFRPDFNYNRMKSGSERLCLEMPSYDIFLEGIKKLIQLDSHWVPDLPNTSLYIRPTLIGTEAFLGVRPSDKYLFFVILSPCGNYFGNDKPVEIWVEESFIRAAPGGLGATKAAANYAASLKAAHEAKKKGFTQVLWLDVNHKYVEEVGTMNVFFVFKDEVVTPSLEGTILGGGTRDSVLQILKHKGMNIKERRISIDEIISGIQSGQLTEAFGTGTAAVISPIGTLSYKNQKYVINNNQNGPLSLELRTFISNLQLGHQKDIYGWIHPI